MRDKLKSEKKKKRERNSPLKQLLLEMLGCSNSLQI